MNTGKRTIFAETDSKVSLLETAENIGPVLGKHVDEEVINRRISAATIKTLKEGGLYRMFLPESIGGLEVDPLTAALAVEVIAKHNTAAAWSVMVTNLTAWWTSRLPEKGLEEIYRDGPEVFIAGTFHPPMQATPVDGGYLINGRSPLASNVHEAQWIFVAAFVMDQGQVKVNNGVPEIVVACMKAEDCQVEDTWFTIGMQATDSNDVVAQDTFVPHHLSFALNPEFRPNHYSKGLLYQFPAIGAGVASLIAPVALALARNATDELRLMVDSKTPMGSSSSLRDRGTVQRKWGIAEACVQSSRAYLHHAITRCWNKTLAGKKLSPEEIAGLQLAITHTNQTCLQAVELVYSAAGTTAIYVKSKISRCFMDAQVIRQHGFANDSRYETAAQLYFGLAPDFPLVLF
jgi:alkylation response protein AidB-like acyl-CoA dehydrogenase